MAGFTNDETQGSFGIVCPLGKSVSDKRTDEHNYIITLFWCRGCNYQLTTSERYCWNCRYDTYRGIYIVEVPLLSFITAALEEKETEVEELEPKATDGYLSLAEMGRWVRGTLLLPAIGWQVCALMCSFGGFALWGWDYHALFNLFSIVGAMAVLYAIYLHTHGKKVSILELSGL